MMWFEAGDGVLSPIIARIRALQLDGLEESLRQCVYEEQEDLLSYPRTGNRSVRRTKAALDTALDTAAENMSELTNEYLVSPQQPLLPATVLHYRKRAAAWAIATILLQEEQKGKTNVRNR